ncbi:sterol desaturase family protein [Flavobacterium branchiophilum]|uniref:Sterol desaturase n=1 Tax=Flavobacterium branchiophilum TaxID=55197 RepID=A0A2H3KIU3_9FLAO|nr:sterol desaturase family protein [Flavobacterium branchiophilum]PDS21838.1 sterol desaturase [Flavobacterium branchiophilum]
MNEIIHYFSSIPSSHRGFILAFGIAIFWVIENIKPFQAFDYLKWSHGMVNIFFTITTIVVNFILAFILIMASSWVTQQHLGLLAVLGIENIWVYTVMGLLLMDFIGAYLVHYIEHKVPVLWRLHLIHHSDPWVDTTTANRHHPGESVVRFVFTTMAVIVVGSPIWMVFLYQTLSVVATQFNHANVALPDKIDQFLSYFIVTPNMHKVHHHYQMPYTDSNYGNIFSVWDRLFGTFSELEGGAIVFGIDTDMDKNNNNSIIYLLKMPFFNKK